MSLLTASATFSASGMPSSSSRSMEPVESVRRLSGMPNLPAALLATLMLPGLAACAHSSATERAAEQTGSIEVTTEQRLGDDGRRYIEGAVTEIILRDESGQEVSPEAGNDHRFTNLPPGDYTIEPALRPCSGSCDVLDPRTDQCSAVVPVDTSTVRLHVVFRVSEPCQVHDGT